MHSTRAFSRDEGSAFVISILILFVLTVLGMAVMLTTTTEADIAINYRWGEQAFFNADAALEYGKNVIAAWVLSNGDFAGLLPPARTDVTVPNSGAPWGLGTPAHPDTNACDSTTPGCRDYQYGVDRCQPDGSGPCVRIYIGRVLTRPDGTLTQYDFRCHATPCPRQLQPAVYGDLDGDGFADLEGSFTIWARRPIVGDQDYGAPTVTEPLGRHDRVILTAEGTAPGAMGAGAGRPVSLRRLEMTIRRPSGGLEGDEYSDTSRASDAGVRRTTYGPSNAVDFPAN